LGFSLEIYSRPYVHALQLFSSSWSCGAHLLGPCFVLLASVQVREARVLQFLRKVLHVGISGSESCLKGCVDVFDCVNMNCVFLLDKFLVLHV